MVIAIDGPAGAGKSTVARGVADGARLHLPRLRGDVSLRGAGRDRARGRTSTTPRRSAQLARSLEIDLDGDRVVLDGRDVSNAIREARVTEASSRVSVHPPVREAMVARQRRLIAAGALCRRGPRHRHRGQPRLAAEGLPHRLAPRSGRGAARPRAGRTRRRAGGAARARPARRDPRAQRPARRRRTRSSSTPPALSLEEVVERVVGLARERGLA